MNVIQRLQANQQTTEAWIEDMLRRLRGPKFQGTERVCPRCGRLAQGNEIQCQSLIAGRLCGGTIVAERKDWISTADVIGYVQDLHNSLIPK